MPRMQQNGGEGHASIPLSLGFAPPDICYLPMPVRTYYVLLCYELNLHYSFPYLERGG